MPLRLAESAKDAHQFPLTVWHPLDGVLTKSGSERIIYRARDALTATWLCQYFLQLLCKGLHHA